MITIFHKGLGNGLNIQVVAIQGKKTKLKRELSQTGEPRHVSSPSGGRPTGDASADHKKARHQQRSASGRPVCVTLCVASPQVYPIFSVRQLTNSKKPPKNIL